MAGKPAVFFYFALNTMIHLSPRLAAVAGLVPNGANVIDVGTDHAMIPVWLVQAGRVRRVLATDVRPGPLRSAASLIKKTGTGKSIDLMLADGLANISPSGWDAVVLAGMGGETMVSILSTAPWTRNGVLLILEPQSKKDTLRRWLMENGYRIDSERLVEDAGRIYPILTARGGEAPAYSEAELYLGQLEQVEGDPLFERYLDGMRAQAAKAAPYDSAAEALLQEYDAIRGRLRHADSSGDI